MTKLAKGARCVKICKVLEHVVKYLACIDDKTSICVDHKHSLSSTLEDQELNSVVDAVNLSAGENDGVTQLASCDTV